MILPNSSSLIQDELEVAEALFDLMKQSRSPSQSQSLSPSQGSMKRSDYSSEKICSCSSIPSQTSDSPQEEGQNEKSFVCFAEFTAFQLLSLYFKSQFLMCLAM